MSLKLNLGCRDDIREGYENYDLYYDNPRIIKADILDMGVQEGIIEEILAHSILEHLTFAEGEKALADWCKWLKPGGTISIITPDFDTMYDTATRLKAKHPAAQLYGDHAEEGQAHKSCWQKVTLIKELESNDVEIIEDKRWLDDMWLIGRKR